MISFYKRELQSYFGGLFGWIFTAVLLLAAGAITAVVNLVGGNSQFAYLFATLPEVLILLFPLLTSRTVTREHALQNDWWLNSLPVKPAARTVGKYLAMLTLFAIPTAALAIIPPLLALFGTVNYGSAYTALVGFYLMGAALLAVCSFTASLFRRRVFSVIGNVLLMLVLYFLPVFAAVFELLPIVGFAFFVLLSVVCSVWQSAKHKKALRGILTGALPVAVFTLLYIVLPAFYSKAIPTAVDYLSPFVRLDGFRAGHFDLPAAVCLVSETVLFVFLTAYLPAKQTRKGGKRA